MNTKKLYIAISDSGDGSQGLFYTFDGELISRMSNADYDEIGDNWLSGDGFQSESINVPESFTYEDLGLSQYEILNREDYANLFEEDEEE